MSIDTVNTAPPLMPARFSKDAQAVSNHDDLAVLPAVITAVKSAGGALKARFSRETRPLSRSDINASIQSIDRASLQLLRQPLLSLRPGSQWAEDELEGGALPPGEWWVTDPVEGAINHVHGMTDWGVTATLVRENRPILAVVYLPLTGETYTAVRGAGASLDGTPLRPSAKTDLKAALVGTGQAAPGEGSTTYRRTGESVTAMLDAALVVRVSVPATLQLIHVAAGRMDVFWQYSQVRSGLLAGALLVEEAGGIISDTRGRPWSLTSDDFLAAAPGVHRASVHALFTVR
jgi:myo-inositol-1(or 4)-monophosphatase